MKKLVLVILGVLILALASTAVLGQEQLECENTDVVLVIDRSASMGGDRLVAAQNAAKILVDLLTTGDYSGLVSFASTSATVDQGLTDDGSAVKSAIDALSAGGLTCITCGIDAAQEELDTNGREGVVHAIVLLSDGVPTGEDSPAAALAAAQAAKDAGTVIFSVGIGEADAQLMEDIASSPNYFSFGTEDDLEDIYTAIAGELCEGPDEEVPEFGTIAAGLALVGAIAGFAVLRRKH